MSSLSRARELLVASFVVSGCFSETAGTSDSTAGTDGNCPDGSAGCACYGNGTCDPTLECTDGSCVPPGCVPGEENCVCNDNLCLTGLECAGNVCKPPAGTTSSSTDSGTSVGSDTRTSIEPGTESETAGCGIPAVSACADCVGEVCCDVANACIRDPGCLCWFQCRYIDQLPPSECSQSCEPTPLKQALDDCAGVCAARGSCPSPPVCFIEHASDSCRVCTEAYCCAEYTACQNDADCDCLMQCVAKSGDVNQCNAMCGLDDASVPPAYYQLANCTMRIGCTGEDGESCY